MEYYYITAPHFEAAIVLLAISGVCLVIIGYLLHGLVCDTKAQLANRRAQKMAIKHNNKVNWIRADRQQFDVDSSIKSF